MDDPVFCYGIKVFSMQAVLLRWWLHNPMGATNSGFRNTDHETSIEANNSIDTLTAAQTCHLQMCVKGKNLILEIGNCSKKQL